MCGICGYIHLEQGTLPSPEVLKAMCHQLRFRGPDDEGTHIKDYVALGHRRLSIIDLQTGQQPIYNEDGSIVIVYNGEVYNFPELKEKLQRTGRHRFATTTDTEVIVHLYEELGTECVQELNGMFAFALWDARQRRLFCARDRMGKKPLYWTVQGEFFVFASELKSLLAFPGIRRELNLKSLSQYLAFEYVPAPATIFEGIYKLEPAHYLVVDLTQAGSARRQPEPKSYWDMRFEAHSRPLEQLQEEFLARFKAAVERRLISDVPLGVFLSGGIDSSSVVAMMTRILPPEQVKTFSIAFREPTFDESRYAQTIAKKFGTDHREELLAPERMLEILPRVAQYLDEPFGDASVIPTYLLSEFTRRYVTVALGGDGGDELFCGYDTFQAHYPGRALGLLPTPIVRGLYRLALLLPVSTRNFSLDFKIKQFLSALHYRDGERLYAWLGSFPPDVQPRLLSKEVLSTLNGYDPFEVIHRYLRRLNNGHELNSSIYLYSKLYMQDDILVKVDRASMANSLEVRAPFLDVEVVEFMGTVPNRMKLHRWFTTKYLLKKAMEKYLPEEVIHRPKKGFGIPVAQWFKGELQPLLLDYFSEEKVRRHGLFNYPFVKELIEQHLSGKRDNRKLLWTLFMFHNWYEHYHP